MIDMGSARLGIIVADVFRRNRKITSTTKMMAMNKLNFTSFTDCWIDIDLSYSIDRCMAGGMIARNSGSSFRMARTIAIVFVPGCLCTARMIPGLALIQF